MWSGCPPALGEMSPALGEMSPALGEMSPALGEERLEGLDFRGPDRFGAETFAFEDRIGTSLVAIVCFRIAARSVGGSECGVEHKRGSTGCGGFCGVQEIQTGRTALGERDRILTRVFFTCARARALGEAR